MVDYSTIIICKYNNKNIFIQKPGDPQRKIPTENFQNKMFSKMHAGGTQMPKRSSQNSSFEKH